MNPPRPRVALVTGGGRGIGRAIAETFHRQGYAVMVADSGIAVDGRGDASSGDDLLVENPADGLLCRHCDVRDPLAAARVVEETVRRLGGLDVLVNVAGISRPARIASGSLEDLHAVLDVNVRGTCNMIAAALPALRARRGAILITSSTAGFLGTRRQPAYSAAKEALLGLGLSLAGRLAADGVRVNTLFPTGNSRMSKGMIRPEPVETEERLHPSFYDHDPRHVGEFAELLCRPRFAAVTGRMFIVASGYVVEMEPMRRFKSLGAVSSLLASGRFEDAMSWVLGKPNLEEIGPMPSREFVRRPAVKYFEGADELRTPKPAGKPATPTTGLFLGFSASAAGDPDLGRELLRAADAVDAALDQAWSELQRFVGALEGAGGQVVVELPPPAPWERSAPLADAAVSHAMVGLLRALSADDGRDNLRVNAIVRADAGEAASDALRSYLLGDAGAWINGQLFVVEGDGVTLAGREAPRWQSFCDAREAGWESCLASLLLRA